VPAFSLCSRRRILSSVCNEHVRALVSRLPAPEFIQARKDALAVFRPLNKSEHKRLLWSALRNPYSDSVTRYQHWETPTAVMTEAELAASGALPPVQHNLVETPHVFAPAERGDVGRNKALKPFTQAARADERGVNHYPVQPGEVDVPDNLAVVTQYHGVVRK
jgi:hypothetical protein